MRYIIAFVFSLLFFCQAPAQNMVLNPDFEQLTSCPTTYSQLSYCVNWLSGSAGSPDYYNSCGSGAANVPNTAYGYQTALSGNAYTGILTYLNNGPSNREYLNGQLAPLTPGIYYQVTVNIVRANNTRFATGDMGVYFYQNGPVVTTNTGLNLQINPQIDYSPYGIISDTVNWTSLVDTFFADSAYSHVVIGNFKNNIQTNLLLITPYGSDLGYYYIDDVKVEPLGAIPLSIMITNINVACYGGITASASASAIGGTPAYTYLWSNGQTTQTATGLSAGTYSCTVTDALNQTVTQTVTITQPPALTTGISSLTNVNCFGDSTGSISVSVLGGTPPYTYQWSSGGTGTSIGGVPAGTYTFTVTDANNCTASVTATITQPPLLNLLTTNITNPSCGQNNGTATVSASGGTPGYTYLWSPYGGTGTTATGLAAGMYVVTVTDTKGCTDTVHITVNTSTPLNVTMSSITHVNCYGQSTGAATATASGGIPPYTYLWSNGQTSATATGLTAGTYTVTLTSSNGCIGGATVTITQPPQLVVYISAQTNVGCFGQSNGSANATVSGGTPAYTYQWLPTGGTSANASNLSAGTYTLNVTDSKGCTGSATVTITQPPILNATISSANATCSQSNGSATVTPTGGTAPYTYLWSNGQTGQAINNLSGGNYSVTVTDANGCTKVVNVTITQSASLTINIVAANITCNGLNNGTATASSQTGTPPYIYQWSSGQTTATINNLSAGTYTVTVTDLVHCVGTATVTITNPPLLISSISASSDVLCHGESTGEATVTTSGGTPPYSYLWSDGQTSATANNLTAGTYTVTVTDSNGCTNNHTITITEPTELTLTTTATTKSCRNETQGSAIVAASGGVPPYTYQWDNGATGTTISNLASGSYDVMVTDVNGCTKTIQVTIGEHPEPVVTAGADKQYCEGKEPVMLEGDGADTYSWSPSTGLSCATCPSTDAAPANTTVYVLTGTDANGCKATDEVVVEVLKKEPTSVGSDIHICGKQTVQLEATGGSAYSWSPVDGMDDSYISKPTITVEQNSTFTVIIKQNECFTDTLTQRVIVYTMPKVSVGPDINAGLREQVQLHADTSNATSIEWIPPANLSCADCDNPIATAERDIRYVARVSNEGCVAEDDLWIRVDCTEGNIWLPTSFTPNNDGKNDYFYPRGVPLQAVLYMAVYNRWGQKIFERESFSANDPGLGWDGTFKGKRADLGVYHYYLKFQCGNGKVISLKGDITLLR